MAQLAYRAHNAWSRPSRSYSTTAPSSITVYKAADDDFVDKFNKTLATWKTQSIHLSLVSDKISLPSFLAIVAMKDKAIRPIVQDLKREPSFIFLALQAITRTDPVPIAAKGQPKKMVDAWLKWASDFGHDSD